MTIDYKVSSLLPLHSDLWYNSLGSTCTCHYLIVGTNVKLNFRFVGRSIVNHCEGVIHVLEACSYLGRDPKGEEALLGCRTKCWTLTSLLFETQLYLQSNRDMYIWNQVSCTKNYYANVETSSPSNQWSYPKVSCPHQ